MIETSEITDPSTTELPQTVDLSDDATQEQIDAFNQLFDQNTEMKTDEDTDPSDTAKTQADPNSDTAASPDADQSNTEIKTDEGTDPSATAKTQADPNSDTAANPNVDKSNGELTKIDIVVDDAAGTLFTTTGEDGREITVESDKDNNLIIDGTNYGEVDDDQLSFSLENGQLSVTKDGKDLEGFTPIALQEGAGANLRFDDITQGAQAGGIFAQDMINGSSAFFDGNTPRGNDGGFGSTDIVADVAFGGPITPVDFKEGSQTMSSFLSSSLEGGVNGLEKQKFQYGGYDKSTVTTLNDWNDILATGAVTENADGSVTLSSSADVPRVQFYPDDDVAGGRKSTSVQDLQDVKFDYAVDGWQQGEAAWVYELHEIGDGQAFAFGFNQEGNLLVSNGDQIETDISFVDAAGVEVNYGGGQAHVSVMNADGSVRGSQSIALNASEVHVKGIEVYNRRAAADTEVAVTFNNIGFGGASSGAV